MKKFQFILQGKYLRAVASGLIVVATFLFVSSASASYFPFSYNFDSYSIGVLSGQDSWFGSSVPAVTDVVRYSAPYSVSATSSSANVSTHYFATSTTAGFSFSYWYYLDSAGVTFSTSTNRLVQVAISNDNNDFPYPAVSAVEGCAYLNVPNIGTVVQDIIDYCEPFDQWNYLEVEVISADNFSGSFRWRNVPGGFWSSTINPGGISTPVDNVNIWASSGNYIDDVNVVAQSTLPRVVSVAVTPPFLSSGSTSFLVTAFNDSATGVRLELRNADTETLSYLFLSPFLSSGITTLSTTTLLQDGFYSGSALMYGGGTQATTEFPFLFVVGSTTESLGGMSSFPNLGSSATSTTGCNGNIFCEAMGYVFIPSQDSLNRFSNFGGYVATKFPFSYLYSIRDVFIELAESDTSESNVPVLSISVPLIGSSTPMSLLSSSTLATYVSGSQMALFRSLISVALWVAFGMMCFSQVKNLFR